MSRMSEIIRIGGWMMVEGETLFFVFLLLLNQLHKMILMCDCDKDGIKSLIN